MILKGSQRGGGQDLAAHLMRTDENEHVELHELRGFTADDLRGAFKEAQAISHATKCRQYLFSLSLNPPEAEDVSIAEFESAIDRIEKKLGLIGQPRAIVFHEKDGRRHAHCVWSRIDGDELKARQLSHFKRKLTDISRELYLKHDWDMPRGLINSAERDRTNFTLEEWQRAKRADSDPREIKAIVQDCWSLSDSRASFEHALHERGFWLARGDRRSFVVLDYSGQVWSVPRTLGLKTKAVRERLGDAAELLSVAQTKHHIAERMTPAMRRHIQSARDSFKATTVVTDRLRQEMVQRHRGERLTMKSSLGLLQQAEAQERAKRLPRGLKALWWRVTGQSRKIEVQLKDEAREAAKRYQAIWDRLVADQLTERRPLQQRINKLRSKQAELLRDLRRDVLFYRQMGREDEPATRNRRPRRGPERRL